MTTKETFEFKVPKSVRFEIWAKMNNLRLVFWNRDKAFKKTGQYFYCYSIAVDGYRLDEQSGSIFVSLYGEGNTYLQALRDYAKRISEKSLCSGFCAAKARYYTVPKLLVDGETLKNAGIQ